MYGKSSVRIPDQKLQAENFKHKVNQTKIRDVYKSEIISSVLKKQKKFITEGQKTHTAPQTTRLCKA